MQDSKSKSTADDSSFFDRLASFYKDMGWRPLLDWDKPLFSPTGRNTKSLLKVLEDANKTFEKSNKFLNKIKSRELASNTRAKSIPENATIREEYVKCGKEMCEQKHGPYYYAYCKEPETKKIENACDMSYSPVDEFNTFT